MKILSDAALGLLMRFGLSKREEVITLRKIIYELRQIAKTEYGDENNFFTEVQKLETVTSGLSMTKGPFKKLENVITVSDIQLDNIRVFLRLYCKKYLNRQLKGQERWPLAIVLSDTLFDKINSEYIRKRYGGVRIAISAASNIFLFCHSLLVLSQQKRIKLLTLDQSDGRLVAEIDNLSVKLLPKIKPRELPKDCYWSDNDKFICGGKEINFLDSNSKKYFKILIDNHRVPVYNQDVFADFGYDKPRRVRNGVKHDVDRRLREKGLLKTESNSRGRISIISLSQTNFPRRVGGGYTCEIRSSK